MCGFDKHSTQHCSLKPTTTISGRKNWPYRCLGFSSRPNPLAGCWSLFALESNRHSLSLPGASRRRRGQHHRAAAYSLSVMLHPPASRCLDQDYRQFTTYLSTVLVHSRLIRVASVTKSRCLRATYAWFLRNGSALLVLWLRRHGESRIAWPELYGPVRRGADGGGASLEMWGSMQSRSGPNALGPAPAGELNTDSNRAA
ncbi:hypothetical protein C8Q74DRAFT_783444 [Fomes fomentarius]|nr:hypothetical protein C8Q74DRAFT_783444 [Fomes fomentarius]